MVSGIHALRAILLAADAVGVGCGFLYPPAATSQVGVDRALGLMRVENARGKGLTGVTGIDHLCRRNLRFRGEVGALPLTRWTAA